jgi:hypothetical protein
MDNHVHLIAAPQRDDSLTRTLRQTPALTNCAEETSDGDLKSRFLRLRGRADPKPKSWVASSNSPALAVSSADRVRNTAGIGMTA